MDNAVCLDNSNKDAKISGKPSYGYGSEIYLNLHKNQCSNNNTKC